MTLDDYVGQADTVGLLKTEIIDAKRRGMLHRFPHTFLTGPGGLGKSTLAKALAGEIGGRFLHVADAKGLTSARVLETLYSLPTEGYDKDGRPIPGTVKPIVLFIDEIHGVKGLAETLYDPLQEFHVTIKGEPCWLPYFTCVGATTDPDKLQPSFKDRFPLQYELTHYTAGDLAQMIVRSMPGYDRELAAAVAQRSRRNARVALHYAERVRVHGIGYFASVGIGDDGCRRIEREYLDVLRSSHRAMSLSQIAARMQQRPNVIAGEVEPYLLSLGLIAISPEGRTLNRPARGERGLELMEQPSNDTVTGRRGKGVR